MTTADIDQLALPPDAIAERAGLRWAGDDRPGIRRRRCGRGFSYRRDDGRQVDAAARDRIRGLVIPPAWTSVWIAPEADAHLQATGYDDRGRKQYLYHPAWREEADVAKFERLTAFADALVRLRRQVVTDMTADGRQRLCATAVRLIDECLIRPGSRRHLAANGSFGATTLRGDHVEVHRDRVVLDFIGKGGVEHHVELRDRQLAGALGELLDDAGAGRPLFVTSDGEAIDEVALNRYIEEHAGEGFTAKDLRTWGATSTVLGELAAAAVDRRVAAGLAEGDERLAGAIVKEAIEVAAAALGNTPTVCRSSYVAPAVLDAFRSGELAEMWRRTRSGRWLSRAERTTKRVLTAAHG